MQGKWLNYLTRTYKQFIDSMRANLPSDLPEVTDYSNNNPFIFRLNVWGNLLENLQFYIDRGIRNSFLKVTTLWESTYYHAQRNDYRIKGANPSSVDLAFVLDGNAVSDVLIPEGTKVSTSGGIEFTTTEDATITTGNDSVQVPAIQATVVLNVVIGQTNGVAGQQLVINEDAIADNLILVQIGAIPYTSVDTFAYSLGDDLVYKFGKNREELFAVEFGDDTNGNIPPSGQDVLVSYRITLGANGDVNEGDIVNIDDSIAVGGGLTLSVSNPNASSGGANSDDIASLKFKIPNHRVTLERAVTTQDFADIATQVAGVESAGTEKKDCGDISVFISPIGGGIASTLLRDTVADFFDDKTIKVPNVFSAGILELSLVLNLRVQSGFLREQAKQNTRDNLIAFSGSEENVVGSDVVIGDLYQAIEASEGVVNSTIIKFTTIPYAFPKNTENALSWSREVKEESTVYSRWKIKVQSATVYEIFKDNSFLGLGTFGISNEFSDINFTVVTGGYDIGDEWEFNIYPYNQTIESNEASRLSISSNNIQFGSIQGGV